MADYYDQLLKICGFEDEEIEKERPRIERAFQRLELGPQDMKSAEDWVKQNHDVELMGVRKLLGAWFKELIDLVLAKDEGKRIIYYGFPTIQGPGMAIAAASDEVYCVCPDVVLCHTMGQIFNKLAPILEAGEEGGLPPGHSLCSLQQTRVGALAKGIIPIPDLVFTSSYFCDMGSKADELLHFKYGHPAIYVDGSMDSRWGEYPDYSPQRVAFLGGQLNQLFEKVDEAMGIKITREVWDKVMSVSIELYRAIGRLDELMKADPLPMGQAEIGLAMWLSSGSSIRAMKEGPGAVNILTQEIKERVEKGIGVVEKGAPRVMTLIHHYSDASIAKMIEDVGLAIAATAMSAPPPKAKSETTYTTLGEIIAEREMRLGFYHSNFGIAKRVEQAVKDFNIDGLIWNYLYNCRPFSLTSHCVKQWVEQNTGLPSLSLETDNYDSREYSAAVLRTRVETFADMLRARKLSRKL